MQSGSADADLQRALMTLALAHWSLLQMKLAAKVIKRPMYCKTLSALLHTKSQARPDLQVCRPSCTSCIWLLVTLHVLCRKRQDGPPWIILQPACDADAQQLTNQGEAQGNSDKEPPADAPPNNVAQRFNKCVAGFERPGHVLEMAGVVGSSAPLTEAPAYDACRLAEYCSLAADRLQHLGLQRFYAKLVNMRGEMILTQGCDLSDCI